MEAKINIIMEKEIGICTLKERFISRKNEVYLVDLKKADEQILTCIFKKYIVQRENKSKEAFLLKVLRENGLNVPKIYFEGSNYLLLEFIRGETLLDTLDNMESEQGEDIDHRRNYIILFELFKWFQKLYKITKKVLGKNYIFGDINFRNFIINNKIYGIDLEDCSCRGYKEIDGGRFCAYLLTYTPFFTRWKLAAAKQAIDIMTTKFGYDKELLEEEIKKELIDIQERRKIEIPNEIMKKAFNIEI